MKFSDIHSHFVYGMDDGAQTIWDMTAMLDAAWEDGVGSLIATPHVIPGVKPFDEDRFWRRLSEAHDYCQNCGYSLELFAGAEIMYTPALKQYMSRHCLPTLASTEYVLLEFTPTISFTEIADAVDLLEQSGYVPILAHVERYKALTGQNIYRLREKKSVLYQVNCSTVIDGAGLIKSMQLRSWFRDELIDYVSSDSHNCQRRRTRMRDAYNTLVRRFGVEYAKRLVGMK